MLPSAATAANEHFFCDDDYHTYIDLVAEFAHQSGTEIWAYCLMPNHVHLVMVPNLQYSSARVHFAMKDNRLVRVNRMQDRIKNRSDYLCGSMSNDEVESIDHHSLTGRPLDSAKFIKELESRTGITLSPKKAGRKPRQGNNRYTVPRITG